MSELEDKLNSLLSDPAQLGKITDIARSLMGGESEQTSANASPANELLDPKLMSLVSRLLGGASTTNSANRELLLAMKPYLAPKRRDKVDRALKMAALIKIAGQALTEYGSGDE